MKCSAIGCGVKGVNLDPSDRLIARLRATGTGTWEQAVMTRREILAAAVTVPAWMYVPQTVQGAAAPLRNMGLAPTACSLRNRIKRDTFDIVNHAHQLGLGSVQTRFESTDPATVKAFRQRVDA
jgi:hypothetical protein